MDNQSVSVNLNINGETVILETGKMARQANGSIVCRCKDMVLLATATMSKEPRENIDFFPLTIEFSEKMYSSGKIPGGFFKREGRPSLLASLLSRLIDRPLRPLFPKSFFNEVQVAVTILSYDPTVEFEALSIIAASAALGVSNIPFNGPVGAALVGYVDNQFVINPSTQELEKSDLHLVVAGTKDAVLMIEAGANELSEDLLIEGIQKAHESIKESVKLQDNLVELGGKPKIEVPEESIDEALLSSIKEFLADKIEQNMQSGNKSECESFLANLAKEVQEKFTNEETDNKNEVKKIFNKLKKDQIRKAILKNKVRPDGRALDEIRPISKEIGLLPNAHGSSLFTRGETQSLGILTLGSSDDEKMEESLNETYKKQYYFHYNFPPYSVGEVGFLGRVGRRELGHGALAERAIKPVLPPHEEFPYTVRLVSEILESNGSSSMASVCSGSLALLDCGVPIKSAVSGIAMGLLLDENDHVILSDIQGLEDHYGDMDFKVAGTRTGITALQLDIKVGGLTFDILREGISQAKQGRLFILDKMEEGMSFRGELSGDVPQIEYIKINPEKIGLIIGPGGKMIRKIEEDSQAKVAISDGNEGAVCIAADNKTNLEKAKSIILGLAKDVEIGEVYDAKVIKVVNFGAFAELVPGKEGLIHISKLSKKRIERVEDYLNCGDNIEVKVENIDDQKRISLIPTKQFE